LICFFEQGTLENLNRALQKADKTMDSLNRDIIQLQAEVDKFKQSLDDKVHLVF
jgi:prefoldin subunit 5